MTAEDKLALFLEADAAPGHDPVFAAETAARIGRARLVWSMLATLPWVIAATAVLWLLAPRLAPVVAGMGQGMAPVATIMLIAGLSLFAGRAMARRL